ncbi:MAG: OB-fold domain-containing protein [Actinobacteria bacterium]|nr:OB-fold domain-containing protein [Actinomycetota bacterium]MBV9932670.1 OB-fold domain-containing protein [Actinomycetota bacterium]
MARIEPNATELTDPFWAATRERRYLVQWCGACGQPIFYPREVCPRCLVADALEWRESNGTGTVYAVSVQHRPANPTMADRVPYVVALVEVDAGGGHGQTVRVMSNVINCDPESILVGDAVSLTWEELSDGRNLPQFEPRA